MAIRKVARMGHPILRKVARELSPDEIKSDETKRLVRDMIETMAEYGGIGLAAPQIHESLQVALIGIESSNPRYPDKANYPITLFINPRMTILDATEQGFWEGCLSVPGLRGLVYRPRKVQVDYTDIEGNPQSMIGEDFVATVLQHELDHLQGILYVDKLKAPTQLAFSEEYEKYLVPSENSDVGELED